MTNYRNGDQVLFETGATVVESGPEGITIQFGDITLRTDADTLSMVRRSIHVGDTVKHGEDKAFVSQTLEEGVFLIRLSGKSGANGFRVVGFDELRHAGEPTSAVKPATEMVAAKPVEPAKTFTAAAAPAPASVPVPAPAPAPAEPAAEDAVDSVLVLDTPITRADDSAGAAAGEGAEAEAPPAADADASGADDATAAPATTGGVAAMASSLTGLIGRRRNLGHLGQTEEVRPVTGTDADAAE